MTRWEHADAIPVLAVLFLAVALVAAEIARTAYRNRRRRHRRRDRAERHRRELRAWNVMLWARRLLGLSTTLRLTDQRDDGPPGRR